MPELATYYSDKATSITSQIAETNQKIKYASVLRLCIFLVILFFVYQLFIGFSISKLMLLLLSISGFLASISWFVNLKNSQKRLACLKDVIVNEWQTLQNKSNTFPDGQLFDTGDSFGGDLDLFGQGGLFHHLNRTSTIYGAEALATQLKQPLTDPIAILHAQKSIAAYSKQIHLVEKIIAASKENAADFRSLQPVLDWLQTANKLQQLKWIQIIRIAFPLLNTFLLIHAIVTGELRWLGISFLFGWIIIGCFAKYLQRGFLLLNNKEQILDQYAIILELFSSVNPYNATLLQQYQQTALEAFKAIKQLSKISNRIDQRLNIFMISFFNPYFLYDIQNMVALESWKMKYNQQFSHWMEVVGKIELLNCLAIFAFKNKENVYPSITEAPLYLNAVDISHPLIPIHKRVSNSIEMGSTEKLLLITGSNMSGKTTFLRTIGINVLMAEIGLPVCASKFEFSPMQLFSSIRISDSLQENTSYFMAELKKLKALKIGVQKAPASLVLIDEILRGTNSDDKYQGSAAFVKELIQFNCLSLFATHDLKLGEMEQEYPQLIANYCFESNIENDLLLFDYHIQRGIAKNKNASFLMKQMGII